MLTLWRVQQAQMFISIVFWSLTLTGIFYPYIRVKIFDDLLGPENVFIGMAMIFLSVIALVLIFGYIYDRMKFWKEQITVNRERNPYAYGTKMDPITWILWKAVLNPDDKESRWAALELLDHNIAQDYFNRKVGSVINEMEREGHLNPKDYSKRGN